MFGVVIGAVLGVLLGLCLAPFAALIYVGIIVLFIGMQLKVLGIGIMRHLRRCFGAPEVDRFEEK